MPAQNTRRSNAEVRTELYAVYAEIYVEKESHLVAHGKKAGDHPEPCEWCDRFGQRMIGVKMALHHFGGKPQVIPKRCLAAAREAAAKRAADCVIVPWPQSSHS